MANPGNEASWLRKFLIVPPLLIGAAILAWVVTSSEPPARNPPQETARHVRIIAAPATTLLPRIRGFGTVRPAAVFNAVAQVGGKIIYVHPKFKKGAVLSAGTELVRIDAADYLLAIKEAEANIRAAEAKLAEFEVSKKNFSDLLKLERRSLKLQEAQLKRTQNLKKRGTLPQARVDEELRSTLSQRRLVQDLRNSLRLLPTQEAAQKEQIAVQRSRLETARLNLARTNIRLPFDARISSVNVEITQYVQPGTNLGAGDDIRVSEIEAQFPIARLSGLGRTNTTAANTEAFAQQDIARIAKAVGLHAIIRLRGTGNTVEWRAEVVRASDTVDQQTRTVGIISAVAGSYKMAVPGRRPPLTKGMFVEVELRVPPRAKVLVVPRSALVGDRLYIANKENRLEIRAVKLGLAQGGLVMVTKGLKAGENVVVSDLSPAIDGMLLKTSFDGPLSAALIAEAAGKESQR